jgi:leader peptidase (prepilin peptidase) / N-methyltransferase
METVILARIVLFILGCAIGSFLNVLIDRPISGESVLYGRSHCDHCKKTLQWYDLVPVFSYFFLHGRCRYCKKKLSVQYPIVEGISGSVFLLISVITYPVASSVGVLTLGYSLMLFSALIVITVADLKYRIIPDEMNTLIIFSALTYCMVISPASVPNHLLTGLGFSALFLFLVLITRGKGMGMGDVKYAFAMGTTLGFPKIIVAFYIAFLTGAVISTILMIAGRKTLKSTVPFGPFLVLATVTCFFWGESLWKIFKGLMGI